MRLIYTSIILTHLCKFVFDIKSALKYQSNAFYKLDTEMFIHVMFFERSHKRNTI